MGIIHWKSDENKNQGFRLKLDTDFYPMMIMTFLIDIWKENCFKATFCQNNRIFFVTTLWLIINLRAWAWICDFKPIGRYENAKNAIFNQLVECRNRKLTCISYHLKWRFHNIQENIHQFSDSNYLFGPIVIFSYRSIELVFIV